MKEETFVYDPNLLIIWKTGDLPRRWKREYPNLFCDRDLEIALSQP